MRPRWTILLALVVAVAVFAGVLLVTPPGLAAIVDVLVGPTRGTRAMASAYAVGAAASLGLLTLLVVAGGLHLADRVWQQRSHRQRGCGR
jgi:hypothetical protein